MTISREEEIECPRCGYRSTMIVWHTINAQLNPEAKKDLLEGKINLFQCDKCDFSAHLTTALLYHDMEKEFLAQYFPFGRTENSLFLSQFTEYGKFVTEVSLEKDAPEHFKNVHYVFSMGELVRYVTFRDRLAQRKASIRQGHIACFSCGNSVENDEYYYCVSRLREIKTDADEENKDQIVEAMSSLQICATCMTRAATEEIEFTELQLPLLNLEKQGFYRYAKWHAGKAVEWEPIVKGRDSCSLCHAAIGAGDIYTRVQIGEEMEHAKGVAAEKAHTLAILCESCAQTYLVWL